MNKEKELVSQLYNGDAPTIQQVYVGNKEKFIAFAKQYGLAQETALDVYQDAVVALIENAKKGKLGSLQVSVSTYLFAIGKFMVFAHLKKKQPVALNEDLAMEWDTYEHESKEAMVLLLQQYFLQLGQQCQKLLVAFYYEEKKLDVLVKELGYENKDVVKSQKSRCLKQLKNLIGKSHESR